MIDSLTHSKIRDDAGNVCVAVCVFSVGCEMSHLLRMDWTSTTGNIVQCCSVAFSADRHINIHNLSSCVLKNILFNKNRHFILSVCVFLRYRWWRLRVCQST